MLLTSLIVVFFLEYARPHDLLPFILSVKLYALAPLLLFAVVSFTKTGTDNAEVWGSWVVRYLLGLLFLVTLSIPFGWNYSQATETWSTVLGYILLSIMIARIVDSKSRLLVLIATLAGLHVYHIVRNPVLITDPDTRHYVSGGTFLGDGNDFALSIVAILPLCLFLFQSAGNRLYKWAAGAAGILLLLAVVATQSRGATLAIVAVIVYLWSKGKRKAVGLVAVGVAGLIVVAFAGDVYFERMSTITQYQEEGSAQGRINAWTAAIEMANQSPIVGVGAGSFPIAHAVYRNGEVKTAHSMYFLALGELGYPGMILILTYLWSAWRRNNRYLAMISCNRDAEGVESFRKLFIALNASLIGFAVSGAFLSVLYYPHLFVLGGIWIAAQIMASHQLEAPGARRR